ncbi:MAG: UDP-N-acetylmuramoyl-L-alanyl-D-glutamate--2,6-diaminopimelate ligase [Clostridia bacterium]|nr:UDP-N-acetylmuramoyl-L-alanyl-D-glutamate--2,6-diaminopimelate ligase [Clostridia bacterium]
MKISEILAGIKYTGSFTDSDVDYITDDDRDLRPGCIFVCCKGKHFDSHDNAAGALSSGAALAVCERDMGLDNSVVVDDTRAVFSLMCANLYGNPQRRMKFIAVTGTNGKTTTTFMLHHILEKNGHKTGLIGTVCNMAGDKVFDAALTTPKPFELYSLLSQMALEGCEYCVMELSSQALEQRRAVGLDLEVGIFSNLTQDHLDYHGTIENYAAAKAVMFAQSEISVLNIDDPAYGIMAEKAKKYVTYSENGNADYRIENTVCSDSHIEYDLVHAGAYVHFRLNVAGAFNVYNSAAAAAALNEAGISLERSAAALEDFPGVKGRIELVPTDTSYRVFIDYAHSPDGLVNILTSLRKIARGRIITVFGCGGDRDKTKRPKMGRIVADLSDVAVVTSDNPRTEDPDAIIKDILEGINTDKPVIVNSDRTSAIREAMNEAKPGDIVLLAGKGHETYQIRGTVKYHYDEREIVKGILEGRNDAQA